MVQREDSNHGGDVSMQIDSADSIWENYEEIMGRVIPIGVSPMELQKK